MQLNKILRVPISAEDHYIPDEKPNVFSVSWIFSIQIIAIVSTTEKVAD